MDVRLELAESQVRAGHPKDALATLSAQRSITTAEAPRYFRIAVTAQLRNNDPDNALATAKHFQDIAKSDQRESGTGATPGTAGDFPQCGFRATRHRQRQRR